MKINEKMKRFFTLSRSADGFTLVELIVVIAILAILGGVAVPAYSGYITKTNQTADQKLVSEVSNALQMQYYSNGDFSESGFVVLYGEGTPAIADEFGTDAMVAVYGENWANTIFVKSDWAVDSMYQAAFDQYAYGMPMGVIGNSSFLTGSTTEELLSDVSDLTFAAAGLMGNMAPDVKYNTILGNLFNNDKDAMNEMCEKYDIPTKTVGNQTVFDDKVTDAQLSNLLVFASAQQITNGTNNTPVGGMVDRYAAYTAYVNSQPDNAELQKAYADMNASLSAGGVNSAFDKFEQAAGAGWTAYSDPTNMQYQEDMMAFMGIMEAVDKASGEITADDMKNANLFGTDKVSSYFGSYVTAADILANLQPDDVTAIQSAMSSGGVVVFVGGAQTGCTAQGAMLQGE